MSADIPLSKRYPPEWLDGNQIDAEAFLVGYRDSSLSYAFRALCDLIRQQQHQIDELSNRIDAMSEAAIKQAQGDTK